MSSDKSIWNITDWSLTKICALLFKKIESNEFCYCYNDGFLYFQKTLDPSTIREEVNFRFNHKVYALRYIDGKIILEFNDRFIFTKEIKNKYGKFLEHMIDDSQVIKETNIIFNINNINNIKKYLTNIHFYENIKDNGFLYLLVGTEYLDAYNKRLSINEISKWIKYYDIINNNINNIYQDNRNNVIEVLKQYYNNTNNETTKNLGVTITSKESNTPHGKYNFINICINGIRILKSTNLDIYNYKFHPGFSLFCILMKDQTFFDYISLNLEKTIFKNL